MNTSMRAILFFALASGCGDEVASHDAGADLHLPFDLATPAVPVGGPCQTGTDCTMGAKPGCFLNNEYDATLEPMPGGYCTSDCTSDADCAGGHCQTSSRYCYAKCRTNADCRAGYRCWFRDGGICYPKAPLDCDPTDPSYCTGRLTPDFPGGCVRFADGSGYAGVCIERCHPYGWTCGAPYQCVFMDQRDQRDLNGAPTFDRLVGFLCLPPPFGVAGIGTACVRRDLNTTQSGAVLCQPGVACFTGVDGGADNTCHATCSGPDGTGFAGFGCTNGTCVDEWGLFGTNFPYGLCR
jgi:hypothetical protein